MIDYWAKDPEPILQASPPKNPRLNAETVSASSEMQATQREDVSFLDVLMRSIFGKPELANKPVAVVKTVAVAPVVKPLTSASPASR
jgi:hypothetical protein